MYDIQVHDVGGWGHNPAHLGTPARVYGHMLDIAYPVLTNYKCDLFTDAQWLDGALTDDKTQTFWYIVRPSGTHIATTKSWYDAVMNAWPDAIVYSIGIICNDGKWWMGVSQCQ